MSPGGGSFFEGQTRGGLVLLFVVGVFALLLAAGTYLFAGGGPKPLLMAAVGLVSIAASVLLWRFFFRRR